MGNYLYDDYEAKMKVSTDIINDWNFFTKLKKNFVSPEKIFKFVEIIFISNKSPPYHTKFLQIFYNNLNILERKEYFEIVKELHEDLLKQLSFHESYNNFNAKLCVIKDKNPDRSIFNYGLVKPKKIALDYFFLYVNYHRNEFEKIKYEIKLKVKEIETYPEKIDTEENIKKIIYEENGNRGILEVTYIGEMKENQKEGKGILTKKDKLTGETVFTYIGEFKNNLKNGLGVIKIKGNQMEGKFLNDKPDGKVGIYDDEGLEINEYKNGVLHGRKLGLDKKGNIVTSVFENGKPSYIFSMYLKNIEGLFTGKKNEDGLYEGIIYEKEEGNVKVGKFNSSFHLTGEGYEYINYSGLYCTYDDGNIIPSLSYKIRSNGELFKGYCDEDGLLHGQNAITLNYKNENSKGDLFIGNFEHGEIKGYGEYYWGHGDIEKKIYPEGYGVRYFANRNCYMEGFISDDGFAKGRGFLTYDDKKYTGEYLLNNERCLFLSDDGKALRFNICNSARFNEATAKQIKVEENN